VPVHVELHLFAAVESCKSSLFAPFVYTALIVLIEAGRDFWLMFD
jgi:hypothetical protein